MGWAGSHCFYSITEVTYESSFEVNRTFKLETEGLQAVELQVEEGGDVNVYLLKGRDGVYLVPSNDYYTEAFSSEQGHLTISVLNSPLYLLISAQDEYPASVVFLPVQHSASSDSSPLTYILVGVLVPVTVLFLALTALIIIVKNKHRPQLNPPNPTVPLTQQHAYLLEQLNLSSPVKSYNALKSHFSSECAVCLEAFLKESEVRMLDCGHVYHSSCLESLVMRQQSCCVCKQSFENRLNASYLTTMGDNTQVHD